MPSFPLALAGRPALIPCQAGGRARAVALPQRHSSPEVCFDHAQTGSPKTCCLVGSTLGRLCLVCGGHELTWVRAPPGSGTCRELRCARDPNSPKTPVFWGISLQSSPSCSGLLQTRPLPATGGQRDTGTGWVLQSSHAAGFAERFPIPLIEKGWCGIRKRGLCTTQPHRGGVHSPGGCSAVPRWHFAARGLLKQLSGGVLHGHQGPAGCW